LKALDTKGMFSSAMTSNFLLILFLIMKVLTKTFDVVLILYSHIDTNLNPLQTYSPFFSDGEVDSFRLIPVPHAANIIRRTEFFKPNRNLVIIDFLFRHGYYMHITCVLSNAISRENNFLGVDIVTLRSGT
jgi:hypothetical protein